MLLGSSETARMSASESASDFDELPHSREDSPNRSSRSILAAALLTCQGSALATYYIYWLVLVRGCKTIDVKSGND